MHPVKTGLLAYGMSGSVFHGPLLEAHPGFALRSICQRRGDQASLDYPAARIVRNPEALLADPELELIIVNTPEHTHAEWVAKALEAGKHVVVEKAFTVTTGEANALIALANSRGLILSVFHNRRWDSDFLTLQEVISAGKLGRLVEYEARYDRYRTKIRDSWKEEALPGTGILYNLGSHLIDQTLLLFGLPDWIWADLQVQRTNGQVPDHFHLVLGYPGMKANLKAGYLVCGDFPRYVLLGESGSWVKSGMDPQEAALAAKQPPGQPGWGQEPADQAGRIRTCVNGQVVETAGPNPAGNYLAYYDGIFQAIREQAAAPVSATDGRNVIRVIEAAYRSRETGKVIYLES